MPALLIRHSQLQPPRKKKSVPTYSRLFTHTTHPARTPSSPDSVLKVPPSSRTPPERRTLLGSRLWASLSHHDKGSSNNLIKACGKTKGTRVLEKKKQGGGGRKKGRFSLTPVLAMIFEHVACLAGKLKYGYLFRFWALAYSSTTQCFSALAQ